MSDLCWELRRIGSGELDPAGGLMHEAATEIERLRSSLKHFQENSGPDLYSEMTADALAEADATIKKLEAALAQRCDSCPVHPSIAQDKKATP